MAKTFGIYNSASKYWNDDDLNTLMSALVKNAGVLASGHLAVTQDGAGTMNVKVAVGNAIVSTAGTVDTSIYRWFKSTAIETVAIAAADVSNPRIDLVCIKIDLTAKTADIVSSSVDATLKGTPAGSPVAPATPTNYYKLAEVRVNAGATQILTANITDTRSIVLTQNGLSGNSVGTTDTQTVSNKTIQTSTLSTGVKVDANADENITYFAMQRQALMNSNFEVWQRTTSAALSSAVLTYLADRWANFANPDSGTLPTITVSRQVLTSGDIAKAVFFHRVNVNGAGTSLGVNSAYLLFQKVENGTRNLAGAGRFVTISFWARSSIASKKLGLRLRQGYGTGGSPSSEETITGQNITLTSTWTKYTMTIALNTLVGKTFGTNYDDNLRVEFLLQWGATTASSVGAVGAETYIGSGNIDIAQVQCNAGDVALPYQAKSFAEELALCQRYYEKSYAYTIVPGTSGAQGGCWRLPLTTNALGGLEYKVQKRVTPTCVIYSDNGTANRTSNTAGTTVGSGSAPVNSNEYNMRQVNDSGTPFSLSSSYFFHFTADAEI